MLFGSTHFAFGRVSINSAFNMYIGHMKEYSGQTFTYYIYVNIWRSPYSLPIDEISSK